MLNIVAIPGMILLRFYERLGFVQLGTIPGGFKMKDGHYENICPYYHTL